MKKITALCLCAALLLSLPACGNSDKEASSAQSSESSVFVPEDGQNNGGNPDTADSDAQGGSTADGADEAGAGQVTGSVRYAQEGNDPGNAQAYLTLNEDGSFKLEIQAYDGMPSITGSYAFAQGSYILTPEETNAQNIDLASLTDMRFIKDGDSLTYEGDSFGQTMAGVKFVK